MVDTYNQAKNEAIEASLEPLEKRFSGARIPPQWINIAPQPRKTFDDIETISDSIAYNGLLEPPIVAKFSALEAQEYLDTVNRIWGTGHDISAMQVAPPQDGEDDESYYVLLAGERRNRAINRLRTEGCSQCQEIHGPGPCFERHFPDGAIDVRLAVGIDPMRAIAIQASENIHKRVPPHEEAKFYYLYFQIRRERDPKYPLTQFAREMSRSPEAIRNAIKYCELPEGIQDYVENGYLPYSIAEEFARLRKDEGANDDTLIRWANQVVTGRYTAMQFREIVLSRVQQRLAGQHAFTIFEEQPDEELLKQWTKRTVAAEHVRGLHDFINYAAKVEQMYQEGKLGQEDSPYSDLSVIRLYRRMVGHLDTLLPLLKNRLPQEERERTSDVLTEAEQVLGLYEFLLTDEDQADVPFSQTA